VIEQIEELAINPQLQSLGQSEPFREVEVAPGKIGAA